jgi:GNAT superfamily N-acetyltransferase
MWATYGKHLARLWRGAPSLVETRGESWFVVLTLERHTDVNQCVLVSGASAADGEYVLSLVTDADVPAVVSVASDADEGVTAALVRAQWERGQLPEPLMLCQTKPTVGGLRFAVSRVRDEADLRTAISVAAQGHAIEEGILGRVLARDPTHEEGVSTWIAWDGDEPISVAWLTHGDHLGVWSMMTPPAHRRRGAARAVLSAALAESWRSSTRGAFLWASPAGRPLYESFGFEALDEATVWASPGSDTGVAIGQPAKESG